jgi:hypothetical protein
MTVWIVELCDAKGWFPYTVFITRKEARQFVREAGHGRVRRYVKAANA